MKTKRLIIIALMALAFNTTMNAQEVFKEIYNAANTTLNDPMEALTYMNTKYLEVVLDTTTQIPYNAIARRDSMAYYMYDYVNLFLKEYNRASKQRDKDKVMKAFRETSINNPLFNDPNREFVLYFFNKEDILTQFSLDTDWVKACEDVRRKLKEL